jgi:hypothetical protein
MLVEWDCFDWKHDNDNSLSMMSKNWLSEKLELYPVNSPLLFHFPI